MGKDSELVRLEHDMRSDETLAKRLEEAAAAYAGSDAEILAAAAAELGYQVDVAELERASAQSEEIDLDELAHVAGGTTDITTYPKNCIMTYLCDSLLVVPKGCSRIAHKG